MIIVLQAVGFVAVLVGLAAIGYGIPIRDFGFGNLLIMAGTVGFCTGLLLLGLSVVASELRLLARRFAALPRPGADPRARAAALPPFPATAQAGAAAGEGGPVFSRNQPPPAPDTGQAEPSAPPPWHENTGGRARLDAPLESEPAQAAPTPPVKPKRNLLFSSSVRKDRERAGSPT